VLTAGWAAISGKIKSMWQRGRSGCGAFFLCLPCICAVAESASLTFFRKVLDFRRVGADIDAWIIAYHKSVKGDAVDCRGQRVALNCRKREAKRSEGKRRKPGQGEGRTR